MKNKSSYGLLTVSPVTCEPLLGLGVNSPLHFLLKAFTKFYKGGFRRIGKKEQFSCKANWLWDANVAVRVGERKDDHKIPFPRN